MTIPAPVAPVTRPLRVLHVITRMIVGGAQLNTMFSCARVDRSRFESELLTGPETGAEGDLLDEARQQGVTLHVEPWLVRRVHPGIDLVALIRMTRFMRRGRFDIVHTHAAKAGVLGRVAARLAGVPVVVHTAHGVSVTFAQSRYATWLYLWLERWGTDLSDAVVSVSESIVEDQLARGIGRRDRYVLIRSGVELSTFADVPLDRVEARRRLGLPAEGFVMGSVGRLSPQKAPLDLIRAFARMSRRHPGARLVLVGDGPLRDATEAEARREGVLERVHLLGVRDDVPQILKALDVLVLSSHWEGLPRVIPEAMASGLPVVATRVDGVGEAVTAGENGWLVDCGDVAALAERLEALADDPDAARRMGENGRARVAEFSLDEMIARLERLYLRLAAERGIGR